jgi:formyltetrahydrofolate deformylase
MKYRVKIDCKDNKGIVYKISKVFFENDFNIVRQDEFVDSNCKRFFMRTKVEGSLSKEELQSKLSAELPEANIEVIEPKKKNIILMATKESHALADILIRHYDGDLNANILAVVSNHDSLRELVEKFDIDYFHVSAEGVSRSEHEQQVLALLEHFEIDYIVLAKYMRILTSEFVAPYKDKIINIHHSFLPAFIGANPYKQAYERGVKIIGATAHFVNNNLDEGPIIAQDIIRVNHNYSWVDMRNAGRDVEKVILSRALNLVLNDRVFVYENRTVVF